MLVLWGENRWRFRRLLTSAVEWRAPSCESKGENRWAAVKKCRGQIVWLPPICFPLFPRVRHVIPQNATALSGISNEVTPCFFIIIETSLWNFNELRITFMAIRGEFAVIRVMKDPALASQRFRFADLLLRVSVARFRFFRFTCDPMLSFLGKTEWRWQCR